MRFALETDEKQVNHNDTNGLHGQSKYDPDIAHPAAGYTTGTDAPYSDATPPEGISERRLMTKIDLRVIPVLSILYLLAFLDRTNVANAAVFGLSSDLNLTPIQYSTALTIFFPPYILFEIPSNLILKRLKPHVWLSVCMFMFGLVTLCQGLVNNWGGLMTTRFLLGVFEAGMFPGSFYLISMWYVRAEAQKRYTFFFASTSLAGAFGGLLASAIGKMDGLSGYRGWRWVFILEGLLTCVVSFIFFFIIPDFPEEAKWLTKAEAAFVKARLQDDQGKSARERKITGKDVLNCFKDYKFFLGGFMYFGLIVPAYGYAYFSPTIIRSYGYSPIQTQLHSVPPWAVSFAMSMLIATFSDWTRHRFLFTLIPISIAVAGFGMNLGGHHRRAVGSAWQVGFGNIGGIISTYIFPSSDARNFFRLGYSVSLGFICLSAFTCCLYFVAVWTQNRSRLKAGPDLSLTEYEKVEKGDLNPEYRYML
ncbi:High-affinity nicotinic acid transporter [Lithohypha guttulata]|nr:High-affinity nicotinic acid transporter [Lithohypha guttulata]KAK5104712.1 High-affinity nicotinic acid transporter [Lithohypha guttulata]